MGNSARHRAAADAARTDGESTNASAVYPEPDTWSLVLDFPHTFPVQLTGYESLSVAAAVVWAVYGKNGLGEHPGMAPLMQRI